MPGVGVIAIEVSEVAIHHLRMTQLRVPAHRLVHCLNRRSDNVFRSENAGNNWKDVASWVTMSSPTL